MNPDAEPLRITVDADRQVSALLIKPAAARLLFVVAHGAGAGMRHPFLEDLARALATHHVATLRYQFPYMERGKGRPDPPEVAMATVRAAARAGAEQAGGMPLLAGGKSFGGRMTSAAQAAEPLPRVRGLVFLGFPLHPPGRPGTERADHLEQVKIPMLFLQGTRDEFAQLELLQPVTACLAERATLHLIEEGDHSFRVPKRTGRTAGKVMEELASTIAAWGERCRTIGS